MAQIPSPISMRYYVLIRNELVSGLQQKLERIER